MRKLQGKMAIYVIAGVMAIGVAGWYFSPSKPTNQANKKPSAENMSGITTDSQFVPEATQQALEEQRKQIKELTDKLSEVSNKMSEVQNTLETKDSNTSPDAANLDELRTKIETIESSLSASSASSASGNKHQSSNLGSTDNAGTYSQGQEITTVNFTYQDGTLPESLLIKTTKDYVPPGTFAKAVLLSGADTNAGVHGQTDTTPIVMRILDNGTLPNGAHSSLKGCFVTAASYGDASSERGQIRLQRLSCVRKDKSVLDVPVEGTINDMGGNDGIRGHVVMRNNKIIWNAGFSGFLSGIGNALQQTVSRQSTTPLGIATSSIPSQKSLEYGAYGGANTALGKLADYYIKLADMYHPIVQIHAGSKVNVVFLKGFSIPLAEGNGAKEYITNKTQGDSNNNNNNNGNNNDLIDEGVSQSVQEKDKDTHLGETVSNNSISSISEEQNT